MNRRSACSFVRRALRAVPLAIALPFTACVSTSLAPLHEVKQPFALEDDEALLWKEAHATAGRIDSQRIQDGALEGYLDGVVSRLLGGDRARLESPPHVRVLPGNDMNAFALPDGSIYVYSTLLTTLTSEDQLAAVLGHELTHFTHRHALREQRSDTNHRRGFEPVAIVTGSIFMAAIAASSGVVSTEPIHLMREVGGLWMMSAVAGYSRDLEREADDSGFARAVKAGYAPAELIGAFERMRDATPETAQGDETVPFYASHPAMRERIERFRELAGSLPAQRPGEPDRAAYRQATAVAYAGNARAQLTAWDAQAAEASLAAYRELRPGTAEGDYLEGWLSQDFALSPTREDRLERQRPELLVFAAPGRRGGEERCSRASCGSASAGHTGIALGGRVSAAAPRGDRPPRAPDPAALPCSRAAPIADSRGRRRGRARARLHRTRSPRGSPRSPARRALRRRRGTGMWSPRAR